MNKKVLLAVIPSVIAITALLLSVRPPLNTETLIGYAAVFAILGMVALEYRLSWKRLFGRS